jgi:hypothetical protein
MSHVPGLPYRIRFSSTDFGLKAHVQGVNGRLDTTLAYWRDIAAEVGRVQARGLLVVDDMEGEPPPPEQLLQFVQAMRGLGMEQVRVAYVEKHLEQIPQVELASIFANEHGFQGRVFDDERSAVTWLRYGER